MQGDHDETAIRVTVRDGDQTVVVSGVLDRAVVAAVLAAATTAREHSERLHLDLRGVTSVEGDSLRSLARALRDSGVDLRMTEPPTGAETSP